MTMTTEAEPVRTAVDEPSMLVDAASELIDEVSERVARNPTAAVLASAAAGAALIAIMALVTRGPRKKVRVAARRASAQVGSAAQRVSEQTASRFDALLDEYAAMKAAAQRASDQAAERASSGVDRARDEYASLKGQIGDLAKMIAAAIPSKRDAQKTADAVGEKISESWQGVRDQAQQLYEQARPQVAAAADVARRNPVWTAVAIGALGALLGAQMLRGDDDDASDR